MQHLRACHEMYTFKLHTHIYCFDTIINVDLRRWIDRKRVTDVRSILETMIDSHLVVCQRGDRVDLEEARSASD